MDETDRMLANPAMVKRLEESRKHYQKGKGGKNIYGRYMEVIFTPEALEDIEYRKRKHTYKIVRRIDELVKPFEKTRSKA